MTNSQPARKLGADKPLAALNKLMKAVKAKPLPAEEVSVTESVGRVLAEDVVSHADIPTHDKTWVDGYAVRSEDTEPASESKPVRLKVVGKLFPSSYPAEIRVRKGQAVYLACGAPMPEGADGVVRVEDVVRVNGEVEVREPVAAGRGISYRGEDVKRGEVTLRRGQVVRPQDVGLLLGVGARKVSVTRRPVVAVVSVGDELVSTAEEDPAKNVNNYAYIVSALSTELGASCMVWGIVPDKTNQIAEQIGEALKHSDIVISVGGCSVGVNDLVPEAVNKLGKPGILVHGLSVKPGHVAGFGVVNGKPVIMLPGHVVSAVVGFYLLVAPLLSVYSGLKAKLPLPSIKARMASDVETEHRYGFLRVSVKRVNDDYLAKPVHGGTNTLKTLIDSNGFLIIPPRRRLRKREKVEVKLFSRFELSCV